MKIRLTVLKFYKNTEEYQTHDETTGLFVPYNVSKFEATQLWFTKYNY
jgi:hypothetical protein